MSHGTGWPPSLDGGQAGIFVPIISPKNAPIKKDVSNDSFRSFFPNELDFETVIAVSSYLSQVS